MQGLSLVLRRLWHYRRIPCGCVGRCSLWRRFGWLSFNDILVSQVRLVASGSLFLTLPSDRRITKRILRVRIMGGLVCLLALLCVGVDPVRAG